MSTQRISSTLFSRTRSLVLRELATFPADELHVREIARRARLDPSGVQRELRKLESAGIVTSRSVGNQVQYRLNRRCPIYSELKMMIMKTVGITERLGEALKAVAERIALAYVYGSFASGGETADSDVDLMIVGSVSRRGLATHIAKAERDLSREVNTNVYTLDEYRARLREKGGFVRRVHGGPKLVLMGDPDELA